MAIGIRGFNPIWLLDDLVGNLFDDTFYLYVLENTIPYIPEIVYHDPNLNLPWTSPIQFLANGTLPVDIYFEDNKVYRLEFRQNNGINPPSQSDPLIYEVNNYIPGGRLTPDDTDAFPSSNQITNPQFALVNFSSPLSLVSVTDPDPIEIAPGWFLELAGTGNVTITQVPLNDTNKNSSNAPYALQLTLVAWDADSVFLRQRFQQNGMLWANKTVSSAITARIDGAFQGIHADLVPSEGDPTRVLDVPTVNGSFVEYTGHGSLPDTTNSNTPPAAYVDYKIALPSTVDIYITSIQLIVQDLNNLSEPSFEQDSINRQIDHTFNYFKPQLEYKPIPSYLVGWDFPLNPSQFFADGIVSLGATGANKSSYVWDQTIAFQTVDNVLSTARNAITNGMNVTVSSPSSFALIQYIPAEVAREILSQRSAVQLNARVSAATLGGTVSLWWTDSTLPDIKTPNYNSLVSLITAGVPTAGNGTWTQVANQNADDSFMPFTLNTSSVPVNLIGFEGEDTGAADATFMAIVIAFDTMPSTTTMTIDYCSLVGGDIATRPAPQTLDEVLRECEYYYEKSYDTNVTPGTNASSGEEFASQFNSPATGSTANATQNLIARKFSIQYRTIKRTAPTVASGTLQFYTPAGVAANVLGVIRNGASALTSADIPITNWGIEGPGSKYVQFLPANVTALVTSGSVVGNFAESYISFQYVADVRLGVL